MPGLTVFGRTRTIGLLWGETERVEMRAKHEILKEDHSMAETTLDTVQSIIVELLAVDASKVTKEARFREDLGADSLDLVELIMAFEEKFGADISDEDAQKITTVGEAVKYIDERKKP
jgi:acyl carrier protein